MDKDKLIKALNEATIPKDEIIKALKEGKIKSVKMPLVGGEDSYQKELPIPNSVKQYLEEKKVGGAMTDLPYSEWKKL